MTTMDTQLLKIDEYNNYDMSKEKEKLLALQIINEKKIIIKREKIL